MLTFIKYTLSAIVLSAIILISAVIGIAMFIDPNDYKSRIEQAATDLIGHRVQIDGEIELEFFPVVRVSVGKISVESPPEFKESLFEADKILAGMDLIPLLKGRFEIGRIMLREPKIKLITDKHRQTNWKNLFETAASAAEPKTAAVALAVSRISLHQAAVSWKNLSEGSHLYTDNLNLEISSLIPNQPADMKLNATIREARSKVGAKLSAESSIVFNPDTQTINVNHLTADTELWKEGVVRPIAATLKAEGNFNLKTDTATITSIALNSGESMLQGSVKILQALHKPVVRFDVKEGRLTAEQLAALKNTSGGYAPPEVTFSAEGTFNPAQEHIELNAFALTTPDLAATGSGAIKNFSQQAEISARVSVKSDFLNLDDYRVKPEPGKTMKAVKTHREGTAANTGILPFVGMPLDLSAEISVKRLQGSGLTMRDVRADVKVKNQSADVSLSSLKIFGGSFSGRIRSSYKNNSLFWRSSGQVAELSLEQLQNFTAQEIRPKLRGDVYLNYRLTAQGITADDVKSSLGGQAELRLQEGYLAEADAAQNIEHVLAFFEKREVKKIDRIPIKTLKGNFVFTDGIADNRDLLVDTPLLHIRGDGSINIPDKSLNYSLLISSSKQSEKERSYVPMKIFGPFDDLNYRLELGKVAKDTAEKKVRKELQDKVKEKVSEKLGDFLNRLKLPF